MTIYYGSIIKELRQSKNLPQKELCEDICSQSFISKLEKEEITPSAEMLYKLSLKLGVEVNYFFEYKDTIRKDYAEDFCQLIRELVINSSFSEVHHLIQSEKDNPSFKNDITLQKFILWNKGLCEYYVKHNFFTAINCLENALEIQETASTIVKVRDIEIMNSIANLYNEEGKWDTAKI